VLDLAAINRATREKRSTYPENNSFSIQELRGLPPLFDWVDCKVGDRTFRMLLGGDDDGIALRFFWNGTYEKTSLEAWSWFARRAKVIADIGAHTGVFTLAALAANPDAQVISFEPYFVNFTRLTLNLRANGAKTKYAFILAAGDKQDLAPFSVSAPPDRMTAGGSIGLREGKATTHVTVIPLDAFLPAKLIPDIGLVKIDVEGFEQQCLAGMGGIISTARPVIFFECTREATVAAAEEHLKSQGYTFLEVDDEADTITPVQTLRVCSFCVQTKQIRSVLTSLGLC
jgi:FkbM family methyltransferase